MNNPAERFNVKTYWEDRLIKHIRQLHFEQHPTYQCSTCKLLAEYERDHQKVKA